MEAASGNTVLASVRIHRSALTAATGRPDADGYGLYDLEIRDGRIASVRPAAGQGPYGEIVTPLFVDCHTHLDKGHIWPRSPNPDGSFMGALATTGADRQARWSASDVEARMEFALRCAWAHGTTAIRTHLDSVPPQETISWPVFEIVRQRWKGRIELQAACLFGIDQARDDAWLASMAAILKRAGGVLGAVTYMVPDLDELLDKLFRTAVENGLELDFHADETDDVNAISLDRIAAAAARWNHKGPILIGHCCSLARQPDDAVKRTLDRVAAASISVVSLPMCNLYLQDRRSDRTTPRWRGVTLLHEMAARGINVCVASDNTRDPFYAYGDLDMLEVLRMATRICHFDHPVGDWPATVFANPAKAMGLQAGRLDPGMPADFIRYRARTHNELMSRPWSDRAVYRGGEPVAASAPDYRELDHLMEQK